jgi:hypothetical protein
MKIPLSAILNLSTILIFLKKVVYSHGRVMLHGGPTKLNNQSWRHDASLFQSGLPKTIDFGKIANDHLEIFHEGFGKDFLGHFMKEEGLLNPNPLRNRRSDYESVCKHLNSFEIF